MIVVGEMRAPQREACRQAVMSLALEAVLRPVLKVRHPVALSLLICSTATHAIVGTPPFKTESLYLYPGLYVPDPRGKSLLSEWLNE